MTDFAAARLNMVESQVRPSDVTDIAIQEAMRRLPRETFVPADKAYLAYAEAAVEYAPGRWLMKPREVAKLLQMVRPVEGERALAIAAPYAAAVLELMGLVVDRLDEGDLKTIAQGGYDLVVSEGAVAKVPKAWLSALGPHGRLGAVERVGPVGQATLYVRTGESFGSRTVFDATPPVLPGFEPVHGFSF